jgi:hypothetical protein
MFKWVLIILGLFFLWGGVDNHINYSSNINENAIEVNITELKNIVAGNQNKYITFNGTVANNGRFYQSYLEKPKYASYPPRDVQKLSTSQLTNSELVSNLMGSQVEINQSLEQMYIEVQLIQEDGSDRNLQGVSIIAPLQGTSSSIWVLSPWFNANENDLKQQWISKRKHSGRLSKLADLNINVKNLKKNVSEIKSLYSTKQGQFIPANALILLDHRPMMYESDLPKTTAFALVEDSDNAIYLEMTNEQISNIEQGDKITGIIYPNQSRHYYEFKNILKLLKFPERIGIIKQQSGKDENEAHDNTTKIGIVGGLIMLLFGGFLVYKNKEQ